MDFTNLEESMYLDLVQYIMTKGIDSDDRTGVGTKSIFSAKLDFDLSKGFPLITTKKINFKHIVTELLWILSGSTNTTFLEKHGCKIWRDWQDENGEVGPIYGKQLTNWQHLIEVERRIFKEEGPVDVKISETISPDYSSNETGLVGKTFTNLSGLKYIVIKEYRTFRPNSDTQTRITLDVQFLKTGYTKIGTFPQAVKAGKIKDIYSPSYHGVACIGDLSAISKERIKMLRHTWTSMISRCYDPSRVGYEKYGGQGVIVSNRWKVLEFFLKDVIELENWHLKLDHPQEYSLDKDFWNTNMYSKETCVWLSKEEQNANSEKCFTFSATKNNNTIYTKNLKRFCRDNDLCSVTAKHCMDGTYEQHKGWTFQKVTTQHRISIRTVNQLKVLVSDLRHNPTSRRHLISAWNVGELREMSLNPCHAFAQCYVREGKLSLQLYQRSADLMIGVPYNIASYSLLLLMLAHVTGLKPGKFHHVFGDVHIYKNHFDGVKKQLERTPKKFPLVKLNPEVDDLFSFTHDDIELVGYEPDGFIKFPIAV